MPSVNPYLNFQGKCEEAFNFYKSIFGGEFSYFSRFGEMPAEIPVPENEKNLIMHVSLPIGESVLMGSDVAESNGQPFILGNTYSVTLTPDSEEETKSLFEKLSKGGQIIIPLEKQFWGSWFGMFIDQFGVQWMLDYGVAPEQ